MLKIFILSFDLKDLSFAVVVLDRVPFDIGYLSVGHFSHVISTFSLSLSKDEFVYLSLFSLKLTNLYQCELTRSRNSTKSSKNHQKSRIFHFFTSRKALFTESFTFFAGAFCQ